MILHLHISFVLCWKSYFSVMITITHLFYTRFTHSSLNNIFYTTINNNIILFKNFFPLRFFLLFNYISLGLWGFPSGSVVKNPSAMQKPQETWVWSPGWKIPWRRVCHPPPVFLPGESHRQELGGLQSIGSQRVGHDHSNLAFMHTLRVIWSNCCVLVTWIHRIICLIFNLVRIFKI